MFTTPNMQRNKLASWLQASTGWRVLAAQEEQWGFQALTGIRSNETTFVWYGPSRNRFCEDIGWISLGLFQTNVMNGIIWIIFFLPFTVKKTKITPHHCACLRLGKKNPPSLVPGEHWCQETTCGIACLQGFKEVQNQLRLIAWQWWADNFSKAKNSLWTLQSLAEGWSLHRLCCYNSFWGEKTSLQLMTGFIFLTMVCGCQPYWFSSLT